MELAAVTRDIRECSVGTYRQSSAWRVGGGVGGEGEGRGREEGEEK